MPVRISGGVPRHAPQVVILVLLASTAGCGGSPAGADAVDPCAYATPGAPWIAFSSAGGSGWDVHVVRADGTCRRAITSDAVGDFNPAWAPGGVVAFESDRAPFTSIWLGAVETGALRRVDVGSLTAASPAISPDGATLAFEGRPLGSTDTSIFAVRLAGGAPVEVVAAGPSSGSGGPAFSPDGRTLYFVSNRTGAHEIYRVPAAGGVDPERLTTSAAILGKPAVGPDGALAYTRQTGATTYEVVLLDPVHGTVRALGIPQSSEPAFDPAGGQVVVRVTAGGATRLVAVSLGSGGSAPIVAGPGPLGAPAVDRERR